MFFFSWLLVWHPGKKGSLEERVLLSNNIISNKLPFRLVCVLVDPFNRGKSPNLIRAEVILNKVCKLLWYLHKKSSHKCFPDVQIIVATVEISAATCQVEPVHDSGKLLPHIVSWLEWSMLNKVVVTPLYVFMVYVTIKITVKYNNRINTRWSYTQFSLRKTPLEPVLCAHLRVMSVFRVLNRFLSRRWSLIK